MIWNVSKQPNVSDTKREWRFSFLPTKIANRWYWLEFYEVEHFYVSRNIEWKKIKVYYSGKVIEDRSGDFMFSNALEKIKEYKDTRRLNNLN